RARELHLVAVADEHLLAHDGALWVSDGPIAEPDGFLGAAARGAGDAGHGEADLTRAAAAHALGHLGRDLGAHGAVAAHRVLEDAEQPRLRAVRVRDGRADEVVARGVARQ